MQSYVEVPLELHQDRLRHVVLRAERTCCISDVDPPIVGEPSRRHRRTKPPEAQLHACQCGQQLVWEANL